MYILPSDYAKVYQEIRKTSISHSTCKLIIFVSCLNIDALCAAKILSTIFKKELIHYQLIPVVGYAEMKRHFLKLDEEISNVILVGCGAMLDLESFLELDGDENVGIDEQENQREKLDNPFLTRSSKSRKIYIIDGHRPWNLDNIFASSLVICFDEGFIETNLKEEKQAYKKCIAYENDFDGESESSDENDTDVDSESESDRAPEEEGSPRSDSEGELSERKAARKRHRHEKSARRLKKQRRKEVSESEEIIETYYNQGTTIGTSSTAIIYALLSSIGETNLDNLWLSIVGTSLLDSHYPEVYERIHPLFQQEVYRLNPSSNSSNRTADSTELSIQKDYHLFLLRHWTLYDSFFYSSQVNSKLNLWTESGKKKLHKLFAKMGVSLSIAQQKWLYMDTEVKKQLPAIFKKYLPLYGLEGIVRDGFIRTFGYMGQLSAIECVESLTALLECDKWLLSERTGDDESDNDSGIDEDQKASAEIEKREKLWINNFWFSWDALNLKANSTKLPGGSSASFQKSKGFDLLIQGLEHAKKIQQVIFKTGMSLLERKLIKNLRLYRLCVLNDGSIPNLSIFSNPLILSKLGTWLLENITELEFMNTSSSSALKPLIVASLDVLSDTYLVIGLVPKYPRGLDLSTRARLQQLDDNPTVRLNTFSVAFQEVANTSGAKVRIDSFDSSVIEVRREDLAPFLEKLTLSGLI